MISLTSKVSPEWLSFWSRRAVSALLHAVAVVKAGVFTVVKVAVYIFGLDFLRTLPTSDLILAIAGFTLITASIIAMRQDNLKRRLAYSTISQLAYVVLATFILAPLYYPRIFHSG